MPNSGKLVDIDMNVAGDEKIDVAVAIVIGPGGAGAEASGGHAGFLGYVFKLAIAEIVIERVAAEAGDVDILQAVVVVIGDGHAHAPAFASEAGGLGDVSEFEIASLGVGVLMVERDHGIAALAIALNRGTVDGDDVELAVVVAVDQSDAPAHRFHDVSLIGRRNVWNSEASLLRDIFKLREGWTGRW